MGPNDPRNPAAEAYQVTAATADGGTRAIIEAVAGTGADPGAIIAGVTFALVRYCCQSLPPPLTQRAVFDGLLPAINAASAQILKGTIPPLPLPPTKQ